MLFTLEKTLPAGDKRIEEVESTMRGKLVFGVMLKGMLRVAYRF